MVTGILTLLAVIALASQLANMRPRLGERLADKAIGGNVTAAGDAHRPRSGRGVVVVGGLVCVVVLAVLQLGLAAVVAGRLILRQNVALRCPLRDLRISLGDRLGLAVG